MNLNKEIVKLIVKSLREEPNEWVFNDFSVKHNKTGASIRHYGNGLFDVSLLFPVDISFPLCSRIKIARAVNYCKSVQVLQTMNLDRDESQPQPPNDREDYTRKAFRI